MCSFGMQCSVQSTILDANFCVFSQNSNLIMIAQEVAVTLLQPMFKMNNCGWVGVFANQVNIFSVGIASCLEHSVKQY